jgi:putative ABC transport system ATP-binding protein
MANVKIDPDHPAEGSAAQVQLRKVVKTYTSGLSEFLALKGIDLDVYSGEYVGILGKSGAGKTTLVNMSTGVDHITSGEVIVDGVSIHTLDETRRARWRGLNMGVVFQTFQLLPTLTLVDNIMLAMDFCGLYSPRKSLDRALFLLRQVELEEHAFKLPSAISGGQLQRAAIARALANDPPIVVADEPTGSLDSATGETVLQVFDDLARQGKTVIMVTHDYSLSERFSRVVNIADGEIVK